MASTQFYGKAFLSAFNKEIDLGSDDIAVMLLDNTYVPDQNGHQYVSDLSGEIAGTGYVAGGVSLTSVSVTFDTDQGAFVFDADNASWTDADFTAAFAVIYDRTPGSDATNPLIAFVDFAGDQSPLDGTMNIAWDDSGIAAITVS